MGLITKMRGENMSDEFDESLDELDLDED